MVATEPTTERCPLCGGNSGTIPEAGHHLCQALHARGLPTPSLGERCECCNGTGNERRSLPRGILLPLNPTPKQIRLWFPACKACDGKGYTKP
jgi:hypothetical protein